ncbi:hypothetical protein P8452_08107 [Trifolium repens]|nr:hypothetical protein P8452_08107 [Trifolium repens]
MCSLSLLPYICEPSKRRIAMNWSQFVQLPYNHHMSATSKFDLWSCVEKMKLSTKKVFCFANFLKTNCKDQIIDIAQLQIVWLFLAW